MKRYLLAGVSFVAASQAAAALAGVKLDINVGIPAAPPPIVVTQPPPVYLPPAPPADLPPEIVFDAQPRFIYSPTLGFYVSVDAPYDLVYLGDSYYLYSGGYWYAGPTYGGPWTFVRRRFLPPGLRRYRYDQIRYYRDYEYRVYRRDPGQYRGRFYEPEWRRREHRREEWREHRWEEHREDRWEHRR